MSTPITLHVEVGDGYFSAHMECAGTVRNLTEAEFRTLCSQSSPPSETPQLLNAPLTTIWKRWLHPDKRMWTEVQSNELLFAFARELIKTGEINATTGFKLGDRGGWDINIMQNELLMRLGIPEEDLPVRTATL